MRAALVLVSLLGCSKAQTASPSEVKPPPVSQPDVKPIAVQMTAATLADDCGGGPMRPPQPKTPPKESLAAPRSEEARSRGDVACQQSSMQLAITSSKDTKAGELTVKSVELFDEAGVSLGKLAWRAPSRWSADKAVYEAWDQKIAPSQELAVSYALAQPDWSGVKDRRNKTFVLRATVAIGGADQTLSQTVEVAAPTSLPPNVRT
ncbi:MAG: hypothetical protein ABI867_09110 [Kofleriaceae bacterium]